MTAPLRKELNKRKEQISSELMDNLWKLQSFMDEHAELSKITEDTHAEINERMTRLDGEGDGIFQQVMELLGILNESTILIPRKKTAKDKKVRLSRSEILKRAQDPENKWYGFCPKCSRPMLNSRIKHHQTHTLICREIKLGRESTLRNNDRLAWQNHKYIAEEIEECENDSDVENPL